MKILHGSTPPAMRDMPARPHASAVGDASPAEGSFPARRAPSRSPAEGSVKTAVRTALIGLVRGYRLVVSPLFPPCCRYYPSCSAYALQAIRLHGPIQGGWLALKRLSKCHPWGPGGYDPVPARTSESSPGLPGEAGGPLS